LKLQTKLRCGMVERIENNYVLVTAVGLEVLRKQVSGAGTLGGCKDEGVPVGQLRGIRPMPACWTRPMVVSTGIQCARSSTISRARAGSKRILRTASSRTRAAPASSGAPLPPATKLPTIPWRGPVFGSRRGPRNTRAHSSRQKNGQRRACVSSRLMRWAAPTPASVRFDFQCSNACQ